MWHDDGDWLSHQNKDEETWERNRDDKAVMVWKVIDLLLKLKVIRPKQDWLHDSGYDTHGFVDRNWKA